MKKILLPFAVLAFAMTACNTTPKYTIDGTVEGTQEGTAYLLKYAGRQADTLASAPIKGGKFTLKGTTDEITEAVVTVAGKRGGIPVILENVSYTATLNPADYANSKIEGSENQKLLNEFRAIQKEAREQQSALYKEYTAAMQENNTEKAEEISKKFDEVQENSDAKENALIKANPDSFVSAYIVASKLYNYDLDQLNEIYNLFGANAKASAPGQKINERIQKLSTVAIGKVAPNFTMNTPEGNPLSMYDVKGKVKIIDFWASWCNPCRRANPEVVKLYNKYHKKGLEILGVSLDKDKEAWVKAIDDDKLTWNHVSDLQYWDNAAAQLYAVSSIPHLLILDENNTIVARNLHGEELEQKVVEMLQ